MMMLVQTPRCQAGDLALRNGADVGQRAPFFLSLQSSTWHGMAEQLGR